MTPLLADWVQGLLLPLLLVILGAGGAGWYATIRAERRASQRAPQEQQSLEVDITEKLQLLADRAVDRIRSDMERAEEEHARQLTVIRRRMQRMEDDHAHERETWDRQRQNLNDHINVLTMTLREHDIPVPDFAERTA